MTSLTCLTCTKVTEQGATVAIGEHANAQSALSKHFWFNENEIHHGFLCQLCWTKIDDFHQFYCEIERIQSNEQYNIPTQWLLVKQEPTTQDGSDETECKIAAIPCGINTESFGLPRNEEESANYNVTDASLLEDTEHTKAENDELIAQYINLECNTCSEKCNSFHDLQSHSMTQHEKKAIVFCCGQEFTRKYRVLDHIQLHLNPTHGPDYGQNDSARTKDKKTKKSIEHDRFISDNINLGCHACSRKCATFKELQKHCSTEHGEQAFVYCCGQKFLRRPRLVDHIQFHLNPTQFKCDVCSKQFPHSEGLRRHKDLHHTQDEEKPLQCSVCPKTFSQKKLLHIHEKYHQRSSNKKWRCTTCDKQFVYESQLQDHLGVHTNEFKYVCHVCAKGYHIYASYTSHMKLHDEDPKRDKPKEVRMQCAECNIWIYKRALRKHMLTHTGSQTCDDCGQECRSAMALRYHKAQHRKCDLACSVCGKTFKQPISLKEHMASHTGDRLYHCDFCERTFNSKANRAAHRKKMHPREWLEDKLKKNPNLALEHGSLPKPVETESSKPKWWNEGFSMPQ